MNVREKAESLGGKIVAAPNAMYACDFASVLIINNFIEWLDKEEFSHGAIIPHGDKFDIRYEKG